MSLCCSFGSEKGFTIGCKHINNNTSIHIAIVKSDYNTSFPKNVSPVIINNNTTDDIHFAIQINVFIVM